MDRRQQHLLHAATTVEGACYDNREHYGRNFVKQRWQPGTHLTSSAKRAMPWTLDLRGYWLDEADFVVITIVRILSKVRHDEVDPEAIIQSVPMETDPEWLTMMMLQVRNQSPS